MATDMILSEIKRIFAAVLLLLCASGICLYAEEQYTEGTLYYRIEDESITITGYFGLEDTVTIPAQIAGLPVSRIAEGAFAGDKVKELHVPKTIMTIDPGALGPQIQVIYESNQSLEETDVSEQTAAPVSVSSGGEQTQEHADENPETKEIDTTSSIPAESGKETVSAGLSHSVITGTQQSSYSGYSSSDKYDEEVYEELDGIQQTEKSGSKAETVKTEEAAAVTGNSKKRNWSVILMIGVIGVLAAGAAGLRLLFRTTEDEND